jgi:hypothetical protein
LLTKSQLHLLSLLNQQFKPQSSLLSTLKKIKTWLELRYDTNRHFTKEKAVTGVDWTFHANLGHLCEALNQLPEKIEEILHDAYLGNIASLFELKCKDDIIKYDLLLVTPSRQIIVRINEDAEGYQQVVIDQQAFVVQFKKDRW